jgi:hypothetical protein
MDLNSLMQMINNQGIGAYHTGQDQAQKVQKNNADIENTLSAIRERMTKLGMEQELFPLKKEEMSSMNTLRGAQTREIDQAVGERGQTLPGRMAATTANTAATEQATTDKRRKALYDDLGVMSDQLAGADEKTRAGLLTAAYKKHGQWNDKGGLGTDDPQFQRWFQDPKGAFNAHVQNDPEHRQKMIQESQRQDAAFKIEEERTRRAAATASANAQLRLQMADQKAKSDPVGALTDLGMALGEVEAQLRERPNDQGLLQERLKILTKQAAMSKALEAAIAVKASPALSRNPQGIEGINYAPPTVNLGQGPMGLAGIGGPQQPQQQQPNVQQLLQQQGVPYEPNIYDYRVGPDGKVQRKRKQ